MSAFVRYLGIILGYLAPILGVFTLSQLFDVTLDNIKNSYPFILQYILSTKPIWLFITAICFFFFYVRLRHRNMPITFIDTEITLKIESASGDRAVLERKQTLRANHYGITGIQRNLSVDKGTIPERGYECSIDHCSIYEESFELTGNPKSWVILHRFKEIPKKLHRLGQNTVIRTERAVLEDVFINDDEFYEMVIPVKFPHYNITINIYFHPDRPTAPEQCRAICITNSGITDISFTPVRDGTAIGIRARIKGRPGERYRFSWTFPPLPAQS